MSIKKISGGLIVLLSFIATQSIHGQGKEQLASVKTRSGYDFRTKGYDSGMYYIARVSVQSPVLISVATNDERFIEAIKTLVREMDDKGYENITLLLSDPNPSDKQQIYSVMFLQKGEVTGSVLGYRDESWMLMQVKNSKTTSGVKLMVAKDEYPLSIIKTKLRTTHEGSGAPNYAANTLYND